MTLDERDHRPVDIVPVPGNASATEVHSEVLGGRTGAVRLWIGLDDHGHGCPAF